MGVIDVTTTARPLDRRRGKADAAGAAAAKAATAVTDIDRQLETIANLTEQQRQARYRVVEEAERLKRSLKAAGKRRAELVKDRKKAVAKAERARARAAAAESKYDKEVLADLVRREKEKDRTAATPVRELEAAPERTPEARADRGPARGPVPSRNSPARPLRPRGARPPARPPRPRG